MSLAAILFKGIVIGFSVSAPVGPVGLLCIQRTLNRGRITGLISGLGAATADFFYSVIAVFGITFVSGFMLNQSHLFMFFAGFLLCMLGLRTYNATPHGCEHKDHPPKNLVKAYFSSFLLTISNPLTIILFMGVFAGLSSKYNPDSNFQSLILVSGVAFGAAMWWLSLSTGISLFRDKFKMKWIRWVNKAAGIIITFIGIILLLDMFVDIPIHF